MGLQAVLISYTPSTTIKSADMNSNLAALNGATVPIFNTVLATAGVGETGRAGGTLYAPSSTIVGLQTNFKKVMQNTPTSITLNATFTNNFSGVVATSIDAYGFQIQWTVTNTGASSWQGQYVTVGNSILDIDGESRTFTHHCNSCDKIINELPLESKHLHIHRGESGEPHETGLALTCPECGVVESFNTRLTGQDEQLVFRKIPNRHVQSALIRQLMKHVGLKSHE